jgi:hypothetical protein
MRRMKRHLHILLVVAFCVGAIVTASASAAPPKLVTVAMHDPGCHWFLVAGKYQKSLTVTGPVSLLNVDEAALQVRLSGHPLRLAPVGSRLSLARGVYRITMVGQAPDDNHLLLTVR